MEPGPYTRGSSSSSSSSASTPGGGSSPRRRLRSGRPGPRRPRRTDLGRSRVTASWAGNRNGDHCGLGYTRSIDNVLLKRQDPREGACPIRGPQRERRMLVSHSCQHRRYRSPAATTSSQRASSCWPLWPFGSLQRQHDLERGAARLRARRRRAAVRLARPPRRSTGPGRRRRSPATATRRPGRSARRRAPARSASMPGPSPRRRSCAMPVDAACTLTRAGRRRRACARGRSPSRLSTIWRSRSRSPRTTAGSGSSSIGRSGSTARAVSTASATTSVDVDRLALERPPLVEAGEQQQVLDEHAHPLALAADPRHRAREVVGPGRPRASNSSA